MECVLSFFRAEPGELVRDFLLDSYLRRGDRIVVTTDASPYGLGAVLEVNHHITSYLADRIRPTDRDVLELAETPSSRDQQALEALAILFKM